jgi:hypothetical protein
VRFEDVAVAPTTYHRPPQYAASRTTARAPSGVGSEDSRQDGEGSW